MKCVKCGSKNVAEYLWGLPKYDEQLEKEITDGKIVLGGCEVLPYSPKYKCNDCKKDFAFPPMKISKQGVFDYMTGTTDIEFGIGGFFNGYHEMKIHKDEFGIVELTSSHFGREQQKLLSGAELDKILKTLYQKAYVLEWKKRYVNEGILDGTQWELKIKCEGAKAINIYGSNDYPPYFNTVENLFKKYFISFIETD